MTISERAAGRGFVLGSEGLVFLAILVAGVGFEVPWRLRHGTNVLVPAATESSDAGERAYDIPVGAEYVNVAVICCFSWWCTAVKRRSGTRA